MATVQTLGSQLYGTTDTEYLPAKRPNKILMNTITVGITTNIMHFFDNHQKYPCPKIVLDIFF